MKAPFPWFGGKSRVADIVWQRFGDVPNYVEPFAGSLAVLLKRPHEPRVETINDLDCFVSNFWRALQHDPEAVAHWADTPVNEADLHARHLWLLGEVRKGFRKRMHEDADYFDVKIAGWWVWGQSAWIGAGWCSGVSSWGQAFADGCEAHERLPHLGNPGRGVHRPSQQLPHLGNPGQGGIYGYFTALARRLRYVRACCGQWDRILGPSVTERLGPTGVFLDPPYMSERCDEIYSEDSADVAHAVREWAIANGDNPLLKIALCGYEGEHEMPDSWECVAWKAAGGFGSQGTGRGRDNCAKERIWFSPACACDRRGQTMPLFAEATP